MLVMYLGGMVGVNLHVPTCESEVRCGQSSYE